MAYQIIPGVRQDHKLRLYQVARYPNGKTINVPYEETPKEYPQLQQVWTESKGRPGTQYLTMRFLVDRTV